MSIQTPSLAAKTLNLSDNQREGMKKDLQVYGSEVYSSVKTGTDHAIEFDKLINGFTYLMLCNCMIMDGNTLTDKDGNTYDIVLKNCDYIASGEVAEVDISGTNANISMYDYSDEDVFTDDMKITVSMTALETMVIPATGTNNFYIDWGDGSSIEVVDYINPSHEYTVAGDYQIRIMGQMSVFSFNNGGNKLNLISVESLGNTGLTSLLGAFYGCSNLISFDGTGNTAGVTTMYLMLGDCTSLISLDLSSFMTTSVTTMRQAFYNCTSLISLDLSSFVTTSVLDMLAMFQNCQSLTSLDLSSFVTTSVTTMQQAFYNCTSLISLDLSSFVTTSVTNMGHMFYNCSLLAITADPNLFWLNPSVTIYTNCFYNALLITNYADIPNDWKGL